MSASQAGILSLAPSGPTAPQLLANATAAVSAAPSEFTKFINSGSLLAQLAFLVLVVIVFMIALRVGAQTIAYLLSPGGSPYLLKGSSSGKSMLRIPQKPGTPGAVTLLRSRNQSDGIEFTWSVWVMIDDLVYRSGMYRHIFNKGSGNPSADSDGVNYPNNAPGLYIAPNTNALVVRMNTFTTINEEVRIPDIPLNKWLNVVIRVTGNVLDVYVNGNIAARTVLDDVPKQNYGDVYVAANGGFDGLVSSLRYYNYSLSAMDIYNVSEAGPDLSMSKQLKVFPPYFSLRWYFDGLKA